MGTNYFAIKKKPTIERALHIGKSSAGWKFLFQANNNFQLNTFSQWKNWLEKHIGNDYVILDEYDDEIHLKEFLDLVKTKQKENNPHNFDNCENIDGYRFTDNEFY